MSEYIQPDGFDFLLQSTPHQLWIWLEKETKYKPSWKPPSKPGTKLPPPLIWDKYPIPGDLLEKNPDLRHTKTRYKWNTDRHSIPLSNANRAYFAMLEVVGYFTESDLRFGLASVGDLFPKDVIRIYLESKEEFITQVVGDYWSECPELSEYMEEIREQLEKEFPLIGRKEKQNDEPSTIEPVFVNEIKQVVESSQPLPNWWPKKQSTKRRWKRKYVLMEKDINFGETNIRLAKKYKIDRKTVGHIIEWAKSDPDFDSY